MPAPRGEIERLLREAFPDADIAVAALDGGGERYAVAVRSAAFKGKSKVQQHHMVYAALTGLAGGESLALALTTAAKE
jgi:stress-induced morphogen